MEYTLQNEFLLVTILSQGAEVKSVVDRQTGRQLWWTGDPQYWDGSSPILFPACGGLWNGQYRLNGQTLTMPKHGFVKDMEWQAQPGATDLSISFAVTDTSETRQHFPFPFRLTVTYSLQDRQLVCQAEVSNLGEQTMYYQLGGHPALPLPDFDGKALVVGYVMPCTDAACQHPALPQATVIRAGEQGCVGGERYRLDTDPTGTLAPISEATFANEALIFDKATVRSARLLRADAVTPLADVMFSAPVCLMWQPQGLLSPFLCIEPWFGMPDRQHYTVDLDYRPYSQHVMGAETAHHDLWTVRFY